MVKVMIRDRVNPDWEIEDTWYSVLPRIGDEVHAGKKRGNLYTSDFYLVLGVTHFSAECNGHIIKDKPTVILEVAVSEDYLKKITERSK